MAYVTQGIVQTKINTGTDLEFKINPRQDYAVKHNGKNYILFMPQGSSTDAKVLEVSAATGKVNVKYSMLVEALTNAAFNNTNVEIEVDISTIPPTSNQITIISIKIPTAF